TTLCRGQLIPAMTAENLHECSSDGGLLRRGHWPFVTREHWNEEDASMRRTTVLNLEHLEDRLAPATFGNPWPDSHLTISFAPDKTQVGDRQSILFKTLNAQASSSSWQAAILKAFQTWAANSNLDFSVVSDGGQPF